MKRNMLRFDPLACRVYLSYYLSKFQLRLFNSAIDGDKVWFDLIWFIYLFDYSFIRPKPRQ